MKKKTIFILIMGITIGLVISGIGTYAATTYAISSNKVSYTDNAKLGVDNVQAAIDGTCSNIDNRLTDIENTLKVNKTNITSFNSGYASTNDSKHNNYYAKVGNVIIVNVSVTISNPESNVLFTLPEEYIPSHQVDEIIWKEGSNCLFSITKDGNVLLRDTGGFTMSNVTISGTVSYVI